MNVAVDTNVLVRAVVRDDKAQAKAAVKVLRDGKLIAIAAPCRCEFVWALPKVYAFQPGNVAAAIRALLAAENVQMNRPAVAAGRLSFHPTKMRLHCLRRKGSMRNYSWPVRSAAPADARSTAFRCCVGSQHRDFPQKEAASLVPKTTTSTSMV